MTEKPHEARLALKVHPGARRNQVIAATPEVIDLKVAAPADKGRANAELIAYLAELLGVSKSKITIIRGDFSHNKLVSVDGITTAEALERLARAARGKDGPQGRLIQG
ncbi:MAG: DUF167 domain-containing protein [Chloroflexi bacterium]|nr:DUF167 domain-containing protein [Chloroflexota bacterium]